MKKLLLAVVAAGAAACTASPTTDVAANTDHLETAAAVCTDATKPEILARMVQAPIQPPRFAAGLDLAGTDDWQHIVRDSVESALCAGTQEGSVKGEDNMEYYDWGNAAEVNMGFLKDTHKINFIQFNKGYEGKIEFHSRANSPFGNHAYSMQVGTPVLRDGAALAIDWNAPAAVGTELFDALMATFAPDLPGETTNCRTTHRCLLTTFDNDDGTKSGVFGARDVHFYIYVPIASDSTSANTPSYFYMFPEKPGVQPPPPPTN
jgi:hypothetical protein